METAFEILRKHKLSVCSQAGVALQMTTAEEITKAVREAVAAECERCIKIVQASQITEPTGPLDTETPRQRDERLRDLIVKNILFDGPACFRCQEE